MSTDRPFDPWPDPDDFMQTTEYEMELKWEQLLDDSDSISIAPPFCPSCGEIADRVPAYGAHGGWRFYCEKCDWGWGHPQLMSRSDALKLWSLAKARRCL